MAATKFVVTKNDVLRGIAVFFDVEFDGRHRSVLSTAPSEPATHWEQTVIKLPDSLLVSKGEEVRCNLLLSQDATQARRYNITVELPDSEDVDDDDDVSNDGDYELDGEDVMMVDKDENTMSCGPSENAGTDLNGELETMIRNAMSKPL